MIKYNWSDGKIDYDYVNDSFFLHSPSHKGEYVESLVFEDFIIDVDKDNKVVSYEFMNASKFFRVPKVALSNGKPRVKANFQVSEDGQRVLISVSLVVKYREKDYDREFRQDFSQEYLKQLQSIEISN